MSITVTIPTISEYTGTIPDKATQDEDIFANNVYPFHLFYNDSFITDTTQFATDLNILSGEINVVAGEVSTNALLAETAATIAVGAANYKGDWVAGYDTIGYSIGESASYTDGFNYVSKINNNLVEPTTLTNTAEWDYIEAVSPAQLDLKANKANPEFSGMIKETVSVSTLTLGATSSVQTYTATADFTIVDDLVSGESVTLVLVNGGFTPTYPPMTWWDNADGTTEPTLQTTDKIKFEKVGTTLYGSHIGSIL